MIIIEFGKAELQSAERNSIFIKFPYGSPTFNEDLIKIKSYWNRTYHKDTHEWEVPYTEEILLEIQELFNDDIQYINERPKKANMDAIDSFLDTYDWGTFKPYPYQLEGIRYGLQHRNWILGDTMGLGKSFQSIHLANIYRQRGLIKHCLVICGINSLKYNWLNEIRKFTDQDAVILGTRPGKTDRTKNKLYEMSIDETKKQIANCPEEFFWIINVEKLRCSAEELKMKTTLVDYINAQVDDGNLGMTIVDEIHVFRSVKSNQGKMLQKLSNNMIKIGMSGTLVVNNPMNLYVPLKTTGIITTDYWTFSNKYMLKDQFGAVYGFKNMDELKSILHKSFLRRTKEEVAKDLPPVVINNEILEFSKSEQKVFNELVASDVSEIEDINSYLFDDKVRSSIIDKVDIPTRLVALITRLRQCTTHTGLISSKIQESTKFERLRDILEEAKQNNEKVLVFCQFTQAIEIAKDYFKEYKPKVIVGGMGSRVMDIVKEHEETEGFSVIFAQTQTLGVGHSLPNTSQVVFLSLLWDYATFEQCYNRCHRITSKKSVIVTNLIIKDTYDECIYDMIYAKKAMGDVLVDMKEIDLCKEYIKRLGISFIGGDVKQNTLLDATEE